jgi:alcohol dehydrogenase class IV
VTTSTVQQAAERDSPAAPEFQHATPGFKTFCGRRSLDALPRELDRAGAARAVLFYGASMTRHAQALGRIEAALGSRLTGRFDGVREHSPLPSVLAAVQALTEADADAVIAVGGGSAIVTARAAAILLAEQQDVRELCTRRRDDGRLHSPRLLKPKLPIWVVPTTPTTAYAKAGSAIRDPATGERLALFDPKTRAQGIFFDPVLALTAPSSLARSSALNAFCMAVEGLQSGGDDPLAEALLTHALRMLAEWLPRLAAEPAAPEPRLRTMLAALLSGQGSDYTGGGLAQAVSHAAGPRSTVANGVVEALLLPAVMRYNAPVTAARLEVVAQLMAPSATVASTGAGLGDRAAAAVESFLRQLGVPSRLRDAGVDREAIPEIVAHTLDDWVITQIPRPISREGLHALLAAAW